MPVYSEGQIRLQAVNQAAVICPHICKSWSELEISIVHLSWWVKPHARQIQFTGCSSHQVSRFLLVQQSDSPMLFHINTDTVSSYVSDTDKQFHSQLQKNLFPNQKLLYFFTTWYQHGGYNMATLTVRVDFGQVFPKCCQLIIYKWTYNFNW